MRNKFVVYSHFHFLNFFRNIIMTSYDESALVAKGVKSLRIFVERLESDGVTPTTRNHLKASSFILLFKPRMC